MEFVSNLEVSEETIVIERIKTTVEQKLQEHLEGFKTFMLMERYAVKQCSVRLKKLPHTEKSNVTIRQTSNNICIDKEKRLQMNRNTTKSRQKQYLKQSDVISHVSSLSLNIPNFKRKSRCSTKNLEFVSHSDSEKSIVIENITTTPEQIQQDQLEDFKTLMLMEDHAIKQCYIRLKKLPPKKKINVTIPQISNIRR